MKYKFELTFVIKTEGPNGWGAQSIDVVQDTTLTGVLAQFFITIASVHRRLLTDLKQELDVIDDDIPF